jgi:alpha-L-fucosidase
MKQKSTILILVILILAVQCKIKDAVPPPKPHLPIPSKIQLEWQKHEMLMFVHFGIKTFYPSDNHMGAGTEDPNKFNPEKFDARQWVEAAKAGGFKGIVLTTKHHDGFCNWQSNTTDHCLKSSAWRNGKGDIVKELSEACHESGMLFGLYYSIWDRNYEVRGGDPAKFSDFYIAQLTELLTNYGKVDELWFDGFGSENMKVDFRKVSEIIRELQPEALIYDSGTLVEFMPEQCASWPGAHGGLKDPNWSVSEEHGNVWYPAEASLIAQGNWFYNDTPIISLEKLQAYYRSTVGLNAVALINVAPNADGLIDEASVERLAEFKSWTDALYAKNIARKGEVNITADSWRGNSDAFNPENTIDGNYDTYYATSDSITTASIEIDLGKPTEIEGIILQEYVPLGQRVSSYKIECFNGEEWIEMSTQSTIGYKKLILSNSKETGGKPFPKSHRVRLSILESKAAPLINTFGVIDKP